MTNNESAETYKRSTVVVVKVPYGSKDGFKAGCRGAAKWDAASKTWSVPIAAWITYTAKPFWAGRAAGNALAAAEIQVQK